MNEIPPKPIKCFVVIPAYNEEKSIREVITRIPDLTSRGIQLFPVVVDDGSTDRTAQYAREAGAAVISHSVNMRVGKSFQDGLNYCFENDADIMVNIDADLQYDPADIVKLIQPILDNKTDFVTADRFTSVSGKVIRPDNMPPVKFWGNQRMTHLVNSLAGTKLGDTSSGFRAISREAILNLNLTGKYTYTHETILDLAFKHLRLMSIPIEVKYYPERKSKVANNLVHYTSQSLNIIIRSFRDYKPLYFFSLLASLPLVAGTAMLIFSLIYYIINQEFSPYKFIGFIGIYLFSLGLLLLIIGFLSDILVSIRMTDEKQLYLQKKHMQQDKGQ
jgi:glycosyltransferase involved in cell wall biosynthesis